MALHPEYPYTLAEYMLDISRWMVATKVAKERHGPLLALVIGGAARTIVDEISEDKIISGGNGDIGDGQGIQYRNGPGLLLIALQRAFPDNLEVNMLRAGLEFFSFPPHRDESPQVISL